jgi:hypothetical protein
MAYSEGKIYKLYVLGAEEFPYIGSTICDLGRRFGLHKDQAKSETQKKTASSQMFQDDNEVVIELIEAFPCSTKIELETRERYWLQQFPDAININTPTRTWRERWEANKGHNLKKHREWLEANKEHTKEYMAGRKDISKAQEKARYDAGYKEKRSEAKKVQVECPTCKKVMNKNSLWTHAKTH